MSADERAKGMGFGGMEKMMADEEKAFADRSSKEQLTESAEKMALGLRAILAATDKGALYENRALHLAAGEALGLEGFSSEE